MKKIVVMSLIAALLLLALHTIVAAQETGEIETIIVEGKIQKPNAFYILQRASMEFGLQAKRRSFIPLIERSIETAPF